MNVDEYLKLYVDVQGAWRRPHWLPSHKPRAMAETPVDDNNNETLDWRQTNVGKIGSDEDKAVRKESAEGEPAWANIRSKGVGLTVWRINKFKVDFVPESEYGHFYRDDSYIILNAFTEEGSDAIEYDVHFWIGQDSTADEYGTAAYKTVELDALLDDAAVQHREVDEYESPLFKSYFKEFAIMNGGGNTTGFRHVSTDEYKPRLFRVSKASSKKSIVLHELKNYNLNLINDEDAFILDSQNYLVQINGKNSTGDERYAAGRMKHAMSISNPKAKVNVCDDVNEFMSENYFGDLALESTDVDESVLRETEMILMPQEMFRLSDVSGVMREEAVEYGAASLTDDDAFIINNGGHCYFVVGPGCSEDEKTTGHSRLTSYLKDNIMPYTIMNSSKRAIDWRI